MAGSRSTSGGAGVTRVRRASVRAGRTNEDRLGRCGQYFWVFDGSTPLYAPRSRGQESPARRFVDVLDEALRANVCGADAAPAAAIAAVAEEGARFLRRRRPSRPGRLPSAAVGLIRLRRARLEYVLLGDITVVVESRDGLRHVTDSRVTRLDKRALAVAEREQAKGTASRNVLQDVLREHRDRMNRRYGYWVLGAEPAAASYAERGSVALHGKTRALLASDGFARLVDPFGLYDWQGLLSAASRRPLRELVSELRAAERDDPDCVEYPRLSRSDDASAMYVEYEPPAG
jgi:hypothetical protein